MEVLCAFASLLLGVEKAQIVPVHGISLATGYCSINLCPSGAPGKAGLIWSGASPAPVIARLTGRRASVRRSKRAVASELVAASLRQAASLPEKV